ncbi:MAG: 4Fe-4S binding protein [Deltaproteobacteria bacterium]|jgi:Fe-S-cluster-containing dehydrogenase component|nr:4Fe-4S binding protein [Deltaproteobacteria bacterium]
MNRLVFEPKLCVGCFACEVACKGEYQLPPGIRWIQVEKGAEITNEGTPWIPLNLKVCQHCAFPPCVSVCPAGAIEQIKDGLILLNEEKCNGCQKCLEACPFGAIAFDPSRQMASKCNLCIHQASPRCVTYCPSGALTFAATSDSGPAPQRG